MVARIRCYRKHWLVLPLCALTLLFGVRLASQQRQPSQAQPPADPHAAIRANNLGAAYLNQQRMEQALAQFKQAQAADPKLDAARVNEGIALLNLQRIEPARALLSKIVERDPKNTRAWYNLGLLEKNTGDAERALTAFEKAAALDPDDADTHYFIGTLHSQLQKYDAAIAAFQRAIKLNRFHVSAEFGLARAMQRLGNAEQARVHLARFQHLNTEKLGAPMSLAYGDQGKYSLAETVTLPPSAAPPPIPVKFVPAPAPGSGGPRLVRGEPVTAEVVGDYDNDGKQDLAVIAGGHVVLLRNEGPGKERDVTEAAGIRPDICQGRLLFFDFDHDGDLDLYVTGCLVWHAGADHNSRDERYVRENTSPQNILWRNNGNGTFTDWSKETGLDGPSLGAIPVAADFNNDRAVDLVLAGPAPPAPASPPATSGPMGPVFLWNEREGPFAVSRTMNLFDASQITAAVAVDLDRDGWMDLVFAHKTSPGVTAWRNETGEAGRAFRRVSTPAIHSATHIVSVDYDNDGWPDLIVLSQGNGNAELRVLRNEGRRGFRDVSSEMGLSGLVVGRPQRLAVADLDNDGDADLLASQTDGSTLLVHNEGGNKNNWLKLSLRGLADNKSAIGTKVELFAGATYQKFEIQSSSGYLGQNAPDLLVGLGQEKQADVVRLLWPTGVLQDEVNLAANQRHEIMQIDRRGSSCPVLFAWNGSRYEFVADAIGPGIVGHWVAPGMRNTSDPTEYIKIPGTLLRERRGPRGERLLSFRFAEPMEEIVYLDQLRLFAIDHLSDTDVNPSERFYASGPPFPTGEPVFTQRSNAKPPANARDHGGRDVTALLRARDRRYVSDFADAPYKGFAELHWIEFDLGDAASAMSFRGSAQSAEPRNLLVSEALAKSRSLASLGMTTKNRMTAKSDAQPLRLLLHGYTDYFTATSVYAAHQGGVTAIVPYVEALTPAGKWVRVVDDMGFPAGLARTMVADLTGKLPLGTRRIRIATNLKIYWDQILIDTTPEGTPHRISEAPLAAARAGYLGYPREIRSTPASDIRYDYHTVSATGPYARAAGHYTRYGDVLALVAGADDRFVLMGSGDEVAVEFDAAALPSVPAGWTRDWFFYVDGFAKDMDFYAAHPFTVTPLPYHAMPGYPYDANAHRYPDHSPHLEDQLELNTRAVSGRDAPSYRYKYPK